MIIIKKTKIGRLRCVCNVVKMEAQEPVKRLFLYDPDGKKKVGRPKLRRRDGVQRDAERAGIRNWRMAARLHGWRGLLQQARVLSLIHI